MNRTERCEACPDEHTIKCGTCGDEPTEMKLTYTFILRDGICSIEGLHKDLDYMVNASGCELLSSTLESPDEISENDYREGAEEDA